MPTVDILLPDRVILVNESRHGNVVSVSVVKFWKIELISLDGNEQRYDGKDEVREGNVIRFILVM